VSNTERAPQPVVCRPGDVGPLNRHGVSVIAPREVPLGGPRAMTVRRTLPSRERSFVGAWCFVDHYGPDDVRSSGGMDVPPHPHTGLATVSWLFEGEVEHRDSAGVHTLIRPGELNLMTSGAGIAHSEVSTARTTALHGVQLWVVLPGDRAQGERDFAHFAPAWVTRSSVRVRVFLGEVEDVRSPVATPTPLVGAEVVLQPGSTWRPAVDRGHEHAVLVDAGEVIVNGVPLGRAELGCMDAGLTELQIVNPGTVPARLLLLGGEPFEEDVIMWWNFIGRSGEEIARYREEWQAGADRFGTVAGYTGAVERLPAPALPTTNLKPRGNRRRR
jgi:redox-sensitive bicupin YhaK (pirin superfamily)